VEPGWRNKHRKTGVCQYGHLMLLKFLVFGKIHGGSLRKKSKNEKKAKTKKKNNKLANRL